MAVIEFEDANQILAELGMAVDIAMQDKNVEILMESALQVAVSSEVYGKYTPIFYRRRGPAGAGLGDPETFETTYDSVSKTLEMEAAATGNPNYTPTDGRVDAIVEAGGPYNYRLRPYPGPRPFYAKADELLEGQIGIIDASVEETINGVLDGTL